jgi:hypothetical protein
MRRPRRGGVLRARLACTHHNKPRHGQRSSSKRPQTRCAHTHLQVAMRWQESMKEQLPRDSIVKRVTIFLRAAHDVRAAWLT